MSKGQGNNKDWQELTVAERIAWLGENPTAKYYFNFDGNPVLVRIGDTLVNERELNRPVELPAPDEPALPDGPQAPAPELPEVASLRKLLDSAAVVIAATAKTVESMNSIAIMAVRFDDEARQLHTQARWLISLLGKAYGMEYMPPNLPLPKTRRAFEEGSPASEANIAYNRER